MKVGVPKEIAEDETRVGLVPETVGKLVKDGFEVLVETGAGRNYNIDENYEEAGAKMASDAAEVYGEGRRPGLRPHPRHLRSRRLRPRVGVGHPGHLKRGSEVSC